MNWLMYNLHESQKDIPVAIAVIAGQLICIHCKGANPIEKTTIGVCPT